ncbi:outer membrane beta-barrel protein [Candidatus Megaera polyxenophila]|jgi:opacity protein-like surface antigen|uniref:outer membrane protein n=1 Tax=Candidatus Megaera polyxenophila TaxID=988779 RepID=UPI00249DFD2A|nr:outer membrane beta-barrel protein [Candidatus Megaera polyxenophila]
MKKILLAAATVATLASSCAYAAEDTFYVKGQVGWDKLNKVKGLKSKNNVFLGLGVGYYVMDNVRADLTWDHYFDPKHKGTIDGEKVKLKSKADTLMVNGFVDLFDVSVAKVFAGAGVGMSMISGKISDEDDSYKIKKKNNFAYAVHLGAATEFAPGVNGELTYSFRDMGKFKKNKDSTISAPSLKGHHVAAGVRFDL